MHSVQHAARHAHVLPCVCCSLALMLMLAFASPAVAQFEIPDKDTIVPSPESIKDQDALIQKGTTVLCSSTKGDIRMIIMQEWAPKGAARILKLVKAGCFDKLPLFRVLPSFLTQFGMSCKEECRLFTGGDQSLLGEFPDDKSKNMAFQDGVMSFAGSGQNSRTTQVFVTHGDQEGLGKQPWEVPFGFVPKRDMDTWKRIYSGYGDIVPFNKDGIDPSIMINIEGCATLNQTFPKLDYINSCSVLSAEEAKAHRERAEAATQKAKGGSSTGNRPGKGKRSYVVPAQAEVRTQKGLSSSMNVQSGAFDAFSGAMAINFGVLASAALFVVYRVWIVRNRRRAGQSKGARAL